MEEQQLSNEQWGRALALFPDILESSDPLGAIANQSDGDVRTALESLWRQHQEAERSHFLQDPLTLVGDFARSGEDVFVPGEILSERFTVSSLLGRGGMGEVYLAADKLLRELVALKTMNRVLAGYGENRERFIAEVQNSRQVTHRNVCRIFDIFEHRGIPFFCMEYVPGPTLANVLSLGRPAPERGRRLAIQAAEGLLAAHNTGILHCDFKPANILLQGSEPNERAVITDFGVARALGSSEANVAGTPAYMAPELKRGDPPSVRSDIYAFGKVLEALLPKHKLVIDCLAADAKRRPESMEIVLKELRGGLSRRDMLAGGLLLAGASAYMGYRVRSSGPAIMGQQRVQVNWFQSDVPETEKARSIRILFLMALRQSPRVSILGDRKYRVKDSASGETKTLAAGFPLPPSELLQTARDQKVNLAIDGNLKSKDGGLQLTIQVYEVGTAKPLYIKEIQEGDPSKLVALAEEAAKDVRRNAMGESNLQKTYMPLDQITSANPDALDFYLSAVAAYEGGKAEQALILLDEALKIDRNFVLGHHYRAMALFAKEELDPALESETIALENCGKVTERERNWIKGVYANLIRDFERFEEAMHANTTLFPDEAIFRRMHAMALMRLGRYSEAIQENRKALELDPFSLNNVSELLMNFAEAGQADQCFAEEKKLRESGAELSMAHRPLGFAYLQKDAFEESLSEFRQFGQIEREYESGARLHALSPLVMMGRFSQAIGWIEADLAGTESPTEHTSMRRNYLGHLYRLQEQLGPAVEQADRLVSLPALATHLIHLREGCGLAFELKQEELLQRGLQSLETIATKWPSTHSRGAVSMTEAMLHDLRRDPAAGPLFAKAAMQWPDPVNLFYAAQWEGQAGQADSQLSRLKELQRLRGKVFKFHFAGMVVLADLEMARCLNNLANFGESLRIYRRVLDRWEKARAAESLMRAARRESDEVRRRLR